MPRSHKWKPFVIHTRTRSPPYALAFDRVTARNGPAHCQRAMLVAFPSYRRSLSYTRSLFQYPLLSKPAADPRPRLKCNNKKDNIQGKTYFQPFSRITPREELTRRKK